MMAYVAYALVASLSVIFVGVVLMTVNYWFEEKKIDRVTACVEYMTHKVGNEARILSTETIKEINENLWKQVSKEAE